jgi:nitronate monooxygenase
VIAGGGIVDGRGLMAALSLGAIGVVMGSRMMMTKECPIHENLKQEFAKMNELDTLLIMRSVEATHRVWDNKAAQHVVALEEQNASPPDLFQAASGKKAKKMYQEGNTDLGVVACGQGMGRVSEVLPVNDLVNNIMKEAELTLDRLHQFKVS